ncbi:uncharacterized protein LOC111865592 [Cryptotermes secundus]|uniref:uncharacterized protein LOC111865592 n=1 Tax=Cryptotermes secundus TaxID=105785 RepID=UPI000CD7C11A|nr:uncharacterized protein LOC111865592 [Cryptotermes secundus]
MAAGIGGFLVLGAGITLLLALLRLSDGSLLLSSAVQRPPRLKLLGGGGDTEQASVQQHSRLEPHLTEEEEEDEEEEVEAAAERWLLYEAGANGIVDLEGIPPPHPHHQHRQHSPPIQHAFVFPPPWNKRDRHPFRPSGSAGEPPGDTHHDTAETAPGAGDGGGGGGGGGGGPPVLPKGLANQFMLRSPRGHREYDVPQIECPPAEDGMDRFACPTPDRMGRYRCIEDHVLCDGYIDCPKGEDEDRQGCMFYKTTKAHLDVLADALLRWARQR